MVLELNTYGGLLQSADSMRSALLAAPMTTIAWIHPNAASAGALISLACDSIYMAPGATFGAATVVNQAGEPAPPKYQSYMRGLMRATALAKGRDPAIAEKMVEPELALEGISPAGEVITFTDTEARQHGYSNGTVATFEGVLEAAGLQNLPVHQHENTWVEAVIQFLIHPAVASFLTMLILMGLFMELKSPGLGFPGLVAATAAALYFAPHYLEGMVTWLELILFFGGILCLILEIFIIPGFGVAGILGIVGVVGGLVLAVLNNDGFNFELVDRSTVLYHLSMTLLLAVVALLAVFWLGRSYFQNRRGQANPIVDFTTLRNPEDAPELLALVGHTAVAATDLRPSGYILHGDGRYPAESDSRWIPQGQTVRVLRIQNGTAIVNEAPQAAALG